MLPVLLRYTDSDYPFGIFKLFLYIIVITLNLWFREINTTELHLIKYSFKREAISIVKIIKYNEEIIGLLTARCVRFVFIKFDGEMMDKHIIKH